MNTFNIQQEVINFQKPWPILVAEDGKVLTGRPDAHYLIGFQLGEAQTVVLFMEEFAKHPESAVGLVPVFSASDGSGIFASLQEVVSVSVREWEDA